MTDHNWDDNGIPLAYLITIRTYGTWLHGDQRKSVDRHGKNIYGTEKVLPSKNLSRIMDENQGRDVLILDGPRRRVVESAIRSVCSFRGYTLRAINIRTNHGHAVVSAVPKLEVIMNALKSNATRELRAAGLVAGDQQVWSRGGSRRYLWKPESVERAINYVLYGQGAELPDHI